MKYVIIHLRFIQHKQIIINLEKVISSRINVNSLDISKDSITFYESLFPDSIVFNEEFSSLQIKWLKYDVENNLRMQ